jgi:hypothetical protein
MPTISRKVWGEISVLSIKALIVCPSCKGFRKRPGFVMGKPNPDKDKPCLNCSGQGEKEFWITLEELKHLLHAIGDH